MDLLIQYSLIFAAVLTLVALGGMFSERSGIINIGLEGIMVIGALGGALTLKFLPVDTNGFIIVVLTLLCSMAAGAIYSLLLAVAAINFKADQTLVGTAMNILSVAFATVVVKAINGGSTGDLSASPDISYADMLPSFSFKIANMEFNWFEVITIVVLILSCVSLYKMRFGKHLIACGEHPQAADSVGINVQKMRYLGVIISGVLGGLGGFTYIAVNNVWSSDSGVFGFGFLALAVMIFGQWKPMRIALAALLFGVLRSLSLVHTGFDFLNELEISSDIYKMLPYIISLIVLALTSKKSRAPKAAGIPYDKSQR